MIDPRYIRRTLDATITPEQAVLLVRISEEAAEIVHAAAKALRHGLVPGIVHNVHYDNREDIFREFADLSVVMAEFQRVTS
jgi:hypothetical protein